MQPNYSQPHPIRNTIGFPMPQNNHNRHPPFPFLNNHTTPLLNHYTSYPETSFIKMPQNNYFREKSNRKKMSMNETAPSIHQTPVAYDNRQKIQFLPIPSNNCEENNSDQQFLRGSCSNIFRKFQSSNNLRNTTQFNPISKLMKTSDVKKGQEERLKKIEDNIAANKNSLQNPNFRSNNNLLRVPGEKGHTNISNSKSNEKLLSGGKNKCDISGSKTPKNFGSMFQSNCKKSEIKKTAQVGEKQIFGSLNEIAQQKSKKRLVEQFNKEPMKRSKMVNGFEVGVILGRGKFGEVFLSRHSQAGFVVAIKMILKQKIKEYKMVEQLSKEIALHSSLDHPNIVRFYGCFHERQNFYLVMQYMNGGTLFDLLNEVTALQLREAVDYLRDIIEAVTYMHQKSIAHRDIKPENIVVSSQGVAKLCDFGWSTVVQSSRKTYCGTFDYAPPQVLQHKNYDTSVDIWCIGILTYQLLTGRVPFEGQQRNEKMQKIVNIDKVSISYPVNFSLQARDFIEALIQKDPNSRPKCQDLLKFKLFQIFPSRKGKKQF